MENYNSFHQICVQVFQAVANTMTIFILPLFMLRIVFSNILGEGSKVFQIIKGALIYFCLIAAFPLIIETLFSIPETYLPKYSSLSAMTNDAPDVTSSSIIPFAVDRILEVLLAGLYWVAYYLHIFFMIVMCSMAPIVFLSSTLLGMGLGLEIFFGLLIIGSSWPIIWYGFDQVHTHLVSAQTDQFGAKCLELILTIFKGIAPVAFASVAVKSPPGRVITSAAQSTISSGKWAYNKTRSTLQSQKTHRVQQDTELNKNSKSGQNNTSPRSGGIKKNYPYSSDRLKKAQYNQSQAQNKAQNQLQTQTHNKGQRNENSRPRDIQT